MQIFVDADACPVVSIVEKVAKEHDLPVTLLCDTNHVLSSDYSEPILRSILSHSMRLWNVKNEIAIL